MQEAISKNKKEELLHRRNEFEAKLEAIRQREKKIQERSHRGIDHKYKKIKTEDDDKVTREAESQFLLDDYVSDDEERSTTVCGQENGHLSKETRLLLEKAGFATQVSSRVEENDDVDELKIFICSRTHSQLSQLVGELRRIEIPSAFSPDSSSKDLPHYPIENIKQVSLGSRKNLCINESVKRLGSVAMMNERCLELQDSKKSLAGKCKFMPSKEDQGLSLDFKHHALSKVHDIEEIALLGKNLGICPYYATRPAVRPAELVTLPYPLLLQKSAREALGLSVRDHVVIIDEAHNLIDAISGMYGSEITLRQLQTSRQQLMAYLQKFRDRLAGKNRVYLAQILRVIDSLRAFLEAEKIQSKDDESSISASELLAGPSVDQINLYKLVDYLQSSKLARKVHGYNTFAAQEQTDDKIQSSISNNNNEQTPVLSIFQNFVLALANPTKEGRFFYIKSASAQETKLKFLLLDPSKHFREIVENARSIILVGGTMSPMDDYRNQLFPYLPASRITTMSCNHVIPPENLFVSTLPTASNGQRFDFTFSSRNSSAMIESLGQTLIKLLPSILDGVVIFFPSYSYLDVVLKQWRNSSTLTAISSIKPVFIDSQSVDTEVLLRDYTSTIFSPSSSSTTKNQGAVLISVIGGRLSEGINFSDRLGRCVIVIGLPWPNTNSEEFKAKSAFIEERAKASFLVPPNSTGGVEGKYVLGIASRSHAENICMRAVNQAIGRAIRHKNDWAGILLFDARYEQERIQGKLPGWIRKSLYSYPPSSLSSSSSSASSLQGGVRTAKGGDVLVGIDGKNRFEEMQRRLYAFYKDKSNVNATVA